MVVYFLDWNRYNANDNINVNGVKLYNISLESLSIFPSTNIMIKAKGKRNVSTIRQGAKNNIITFCMLFNPINLLCRFFKELYSNIFLKSIVTPLVVLIYFLDLKRYIANSNGNTINIFASYPCKVVPKKYTILTNNRVFCKLLRPNNHSLIFFIHLVFITISNLSFIITPLVVLVNFLWGRRSDDRGLNPIPPIPLYSFGFLKIKNPKINTNVNTVEIGVSDSGKPFINPQKNNPNPIIPQSLPKVVLV
tara:strand:- start:2410 stop:3159 length:750 start_codon:yes stop_codon:yes gene_type:complete